MWGLVTTDSHDDVSKRRHTELEKCGVALEQCAVRFHGWLGQHADALDQAIDAHKTLQDQVFYLREATDQSRYLMSDAEESLAAELAQSGRYAWSRLQGTVVSQLAVKLEADGQGDDVPMSVVLNLARDADSAVRRRAYEAELAAWQQYRNLWPPPSTALRVRR